MSIFTQVRPFEREHKTRNLNYTICNRMQTKDRVLYVHGMMSEIHNLTMGDLSDLISIQKNEEILQPIDSRFDYEVYTYIIGRNSKIGKRDEQMLSEHMSDVDKRGDFVFLAVNVKTPFEIGTKHMELMAYALKKELLDIPIVYVAGEMIKMRDEDGRIKLLMNFLSGSYMAEYKAQWMDFLLENADLDIDRSQIEMYWFNKDIRNIVIRLTGTERVEYSNLDFVMSKDDVPKLQFYPEIYKTLREKGVNVRFFKTPESCQVADIVYRRDYSAKLGYISSMLKIVLRKYMVEVSPDVFELKPEYANYLDDEISLDDLVGEGVGTMVVGEEREEEEEQQEREEGEEREEEQQEREEEQQEREEEQQEREEEQQEREEEQQEREEEKGTEREEGEEREEKGTEREEGEEREEEEREEEGEGEEEEGEEREEEERGVELEQEKVPEVSKPIPPPPKQSLLDNIFSRIRNEQKKPEELPRLDVPPTQQGGRTMKHRNKSSSKTQRHR
jgi:hypothetical protein